MYDFILRILSLSKVTSQIPVCSHILFTIDWEKEKHSLALMAKAFSVLQKEKENSCDFLTPFWPSGPLSQNLPRSRIHVKLTKQNQNKIKVLAYLQILSKANIPGKGNVKDNVRPSNWDPQMDPPRTVHLGRCYNGGGLSRIWEKKNYIGNKKPREK